jgi:hypothetical protein
MTNLLVEDIMGIPIHKAFNNIKEVNKYWKESTVHWGLLQYTATKTRRRPKRYSYLAKLAGMANY